MVSVLEIAINKARETSELMPVWEFLINAQLYVAVIQFDSGDKTTDFRFSIFRSAETQNKPYVIASEVLERLENQSSEKAIRMTGAKLIQMINPDVGIIVSLEEGAFGIPEEQVQWLRDSIENVH